MENKELETWLKETKAKNLSEFDLYCYMDSINLPIPIYNELRIKINADSVKEATKILFNQWQKEKEFSPKRGDRVLVWNDNEDKAHERIFLADIKGSVSPIVTVTKVHEVYFKNNETFGTTCFMNMKPLPTEQPKETDFKSQVIELIESEIKKCQEREDENSERKNYYYAQMFKKDKITYKDLLGKIKQLC